MNAKSRDSLAAKSCNILLGRACVRITRARAVDEKHIVILDLYVLGDIIPPSLLGRI